MDSGDLDSVAWTAWRSWKDCSASSSSSGSCLASHKNLLGSCAFYHDSLRFDVGILVGHWVKPAWTFLPGCFSFRQGSDRCRWYLSSFVSTSVHSTLCAITSSTEWAAWHHLPPDSSTWNSLVISKTVYQSSDCSSYFPRRNLDQVYHPSRRRLKCWHYRQLAWGTIIL